AVHPEAAAHPSRFESPLVGRVRERRRLHDAFEQAVGDGSCQLFTILGAAGVGKSRLVQEFLGDLADQALVARGRCLAYGEVLARLRPLVLVFDDIHWGEATFLDLVESLADWTRDAPVLLVCLARSELLDVRPGWGGGKVNATSILLEPLSAEESARLVDNL